MRGLLASAAILALCLAAWPTHAGKRVNLPVVTAIRVPDSGIQPQAAVDGRGVLHLIYFKGDPAHGDLYYVRSTDEGRTFSAPIRVNSHPGSAIATGNIRGAHIAIGRNGRVHAAWNGTYEVEVPGATKPWMKHPMVYTRMNDAGTAFEPERNVIHSAYGLDGGGTLAADAAGNVYVFWHAPAPGTTGEGHRRVWMARSADDGKTFEPERPAFDQPTGACGCCGMSAFADRAPSGPGRVYVLYRSATEVVHRDMYLLVSSDRGQTFRGADIAPWNIGACVMSLADLAEGPAGVMAAWETTGNVYFGAADAAGARIPRIIAAPGESRGRTYPVVTANARGDVLLAWAEGMKWGRGGSAAWQIFDRGGNPEGPVGRADGVPAWSLVAAFARRDGGFSVLY